jgi:hypothetical protein
MEVAVAARCGRCVQPPKSAHGKRIRGQRPERVGGESGVDDAGPPASDVTVDGTRADEAARQSAAAETA